MSLALEREKELPDIPVGTNAGETVVEDTETWPTPSSNGTTAADIHKTHPPVNVASTLSEEVRWLHGAGLSARAHRRRLRGQDHGAWRIPPPISIPEPDNIPPTVLVPSSGPSTTSMTTPPTTATRKRRGFLSPRQFVQAHEAEQKSPNALEKLREMAQDRLKKKLRYAKSEPNLGDQAEPTGQEVMVRSAVPAPVKAMPKDMDKRVNGPRNVTSPGLLTTTGVVPQQEDMNENAIYFTIDPGWRASQDRVQFEPITPVPHSPTVSGRPDSPILHRHYSLDRLSYAAQQVTKALTAMESPEVYPRGGIHPIDELHAYLEF